MLVIKKLSSFQSTVEKLDGGVFDSLNPHKLSI